MVNNIYLCCLIVLNVNCCVIKIIFVLFFKERRYTISNTYYIIHINDHLAQINFTAKTKLQYLYV